MTTIANEFTEQADLSAEQLEQITEDEILIYMDPKHAAINGADARLIAAGRHIPEGFYDAPRPSEDFLIVSIPEVNHTPRDMRFPVIQLEVEGHKRAVNKILGQIAHRVSQRSVIVERNEEGDKVTISLNAMPNHEEKIHLADLGVKLLDMNGAEITVPVHEPKVKRAMAPV